MRRLAFLALLLVAGCDQSMDQQPKSGTYAPASVWSDGTSARPLPDGTIARGDAARQASETTRPPVTAALLDRGRERFEIYCTPCHGLGGHGDGMIVQRGFPAPPDYAIPRLRAADARHFFDVITNGYGVMYSYGARVAPPDRWAIVAYIRALQASAAMPADVVLKPGETPP